LAFISNPLGPATAKTTNHGSDGGTLPGIPRNGPYGSSCRSASRSPDNGRTIC
jgi:hypothetical protein